MLSIQCIAPTAFAGFAMRAPMNIKMQAEADVVAPPPPPTPLEIMKGMPGITGPLDFFDPLGYSEAEGVTEGKIRFYREAELKHGRVAMLAALGFLVGEQFHPLFGGNVDVPSYVAFQASPDSRPSSSRLCSRWLSSRSSPSSPSPTPRKACGRSRRTTKLLSAGTVLDGSRGLLLLRRNVPGIRQFHMRRV